MNKIFSFVLFCTLAICCAWAEDISLYDLAEGHDYYIYNTFYGRPLAPNTAKNQPRLVEYKDTDDAQYLFTAKKASNAGYFILQHKATGLYLAASTQNTYSTLLTQDSGNAAQWLVRPGTNGFLTSIRNVGCSLGVDTGETGAEIGVWYDKTSGTETTLFQVFEANGEGLESSLKSWAIRELSDVTNFIEQELSNKSYPLVYRNKLPASIEQARYWMANPDTKTTQDFINKTTVLRDSLTTMNKNESTVMLTSTDMEQMGNTFSLGLTELKIKETYEGDSIYVLIRNKRGRGVRFTIRENGSYAFVQQDANILVYKDNVLQSTVPTFFVPRYTPQGDEAEWTIMRRSRLESSLPEILSTSKSVTQSGGTTTDKYGNPTRTVISLTDVKMTLDQPIDFHILSESKPLTRCKIDLAHEKAWLIFDNTMPSTVNSTYLSQITINGQEAKLNQNCRIVIYLNGALVMPYVANDIFVGYDGEQYTGDEVSYSVGFHNNMGKNANRFRSFRLKRGYMATLASGPSGSGYSRVYVADHQDIEIPVLPTALYGRISSVTIKKWQYVSKKGWCSMTSSSAIATECRKVRATWFYTWSADRSSTLDTEYIPIRQHIWWPSISQISGHTDATACLSINEPEHSEQHDNCDCKGTVSPWTACTITPDFQSTGMRIGSPAPTDASWLTEYIQNCNNMAYRCDFVAIHAYWGPNEAANAQAWYNQLKSIYNATKRPIWITEWNYGASWTTEGWPSGWSDQLEKERKAVKEILNVLDTCSFVERYAFYNWDTAYRTAIQWDNGSVTPAGRVYRDSKSDFAYNSKVQFTPVWWAPSLKTPSLTLRVNESTGKLAVTIKNTNEDLTDVLTIERLNTETGQWEEYYKETERFRFDNEQLKYTFPLEDFDIENTQMRVVATRLQGDKATSAPATTGYIQNPTINTDQKSEVSGWNCQKSAANGFTKATGDTYLEVWDKTAEGMQFDYSQDIEDLPEGVYELSASVFNSSDHVEGAKVNGSVVLYAQCDNVQYLAPVTLDSEMDGCERLTISGIVVRDGKMRIGVKNLGTMTARWAGADDFRLIRIAQLQDDGMAQLREARLKAEEFARTHYFTEESDASAYVINPSCQRSDTYAWTVSNNGTNKGEASDGSATNAYWNLWQGSAFTSTMSQDITFLPEGQYSASALLRGSKDSDISLTASVVRGDSIPETQASTIIPTGNTGSDMNNGWYLCKTPFVTVRPGDALRITMRASIPGSGWWSADDFGLEWQYVEPLPDGIKSVDDGQWTKNNAIYDLSGRKLSNGHVKKGIYITKGKKIVRK